MKITNSSRTSSGQLVLIGCRADTVGAADRAVIPSRFGAVRRPAGIAGKSIVTDYRFAGPGFATRKLVGWGIPQTPRAPDGASA